MKRTHIGHQDKHTLDQIFHHPASHNLEWQNVVALVRHNGTVTQEDSGHLVLAVNGVTESFRRPPDKDVADIDQVLDIRRFLERAGIDKDGSIGAPNFLSPARGLHAPEPTAHESGREIAEENARTEQQLKTQQREQYGRSGFKGGDAQAHQQGHRQS